MSDRALVCTITTLDQPPPSVRTGAKLFVEIDADYHADFIAALKDAVPATARAYDPETKHWYVTPWHLEDVTRLATEHYERVWLIEDHGRSRREMRSGVEATQMGLDL